MDPIIKWPGGKSGELDEIRKRIPGFDRYAEPFAGGAAVYFALEPERGILGDAAPELVAFYQMLSGPERKDFVGALQGVSQGWTELSGVLDGVLDVGERAIGKYHGKVVDEKGQNAIEADVRTWCARAKVRIVLDRLCVGALTRAMLVDQIAGATVDKIVRTVSLEKKHGALSVSDRRANTETGVRTGIYYAMRALYNTRQLESAVPSERVGHVVAWYFVREFCYASMFRFNSKGEFNVPYGGMAYNRKDFQSKVATVTGEDVRRLLSGCQVSCGDFAVTLDMATLTKDDFIFLDPPYDTEFSSYDNRVFAEAEQRRLADYLKATPAQWLLVVKDTPLMRELYDGVTGLWVETVDMTYLVNMRNRNSRSVVHLYVANYDMKALRGAVSATP